VQHVKQQHEQPNTSNIGQAERHVTGLRGVAAAQSTSAGSLCEAACPSAPARQQSAKQVAAVCVKP
jgi:hypothetical protein